MTVLVRQEIRNCPLFKQLTSNFCNRVVSPIFHSNGCPCFERKEAIEPLAFHRVNALLRTDRNLEQNSCVSFICTVPAAVSTDIGSLDLLREVSLSSKHKSLLLSIVHFFSPNSTQLCCHKLLVMRFPQVLFLKTGRARMSLMKFAFFDNSSRLPLLFP